MKIKTNKLTTCVLAILLIITPINSHAFAGSLWNWFKAQQWGTPTIIATITVCIGFLCGHKAYNWYFNPARASSSAKKNNSNNLPNNTTPTSNGNNSPTSNSSSQLTKIKNNETLGNSDSVNQVGLNNTGNNCYINATLQALLHTPKFVQALIEQLTEIIEKSSKSKISENIKNIYNVLVKIQQSKNLQSITISECHKTIKEALGLSKNNNNQQDTSEVLNSIINSFETLFTTDKSNINNLLKIQYQTKFTGENTHEKFQSNDPESILWLPIPNENKTFSLTDLTKNYLTEEKIEHETYKAKQIILQQLPEILIIVLKRGADKNGIKRTNSVTFKDPIQFSINKKLYTYTCSSLIVHHGQKFTSGHYTCYTPTHHYNDTNVQEDTTSFNRYATEGIIDDSYKTGYLQSTPYVLIFTKNENKK